MPEYIKSIREKIGHDRLLMPATACIVLNDEEEVLLERRADTNRWGLPGGMMDIGETAGASARREVLEETGLIVEDVWLFGVYAGEKYLGTYPNGDQVAVVQLAFVAERYAGTPVHGPESTDLGFFPLNALPGELVPHHVEFLEHFHEYLNGKRTVPYVA